MKFLITQTKWLLPLLTSLLTVNMATAMTVKPMIKEISTTGKASQYSLVINNPSKSTLAIELIPNKINLSKNGRETWTPANNQLLIIPVTAVIPPGKSQTVMVKYIGDPLINISKSYRVSVKNASVDLKGQGQTKVGVDVNFNTLLNVVPIKSKPAIKVNSFKKTGSLWQITLENTGDKYARISQSQWTITDKTGAKRTISGRDIKKHLNGNLILPRSVRVFEMDPIRKFTPGNVTNISIQIGT